MKYTLIKALQRGFPYQRIYSLSVSLCFLLLALSACDETVATQPVLTGHLWISGSTALQPLVTFAASAFEKQNPRVQIEVHGGGSLMGLDAVTNQQADIGTSDVYADAALYSDPNLTDHIVCIVPFVVIANPDVPLTSITSQQLVDIFSTGRLHNWSKLGGLDEPIIPVNRSDTSGTRASFLKEILGGKSEQKALQHADSSQHMLQMVAQTPGAIGYIALSSLNSSIHTLAIDGHTATPKAIASGKYAFWGYEHMYTMSNNKNMLLTPFLKFMLSSTVQDQARRMGYISLVQIPLRPTTWLSPTRDSKQSIQANASKGLVTYALF